MSDNEDLICPSAQPEMDGAQVLGVVERGPDGPALSYANGHVPVSDELLEAAAPVPPQMVFRFAAPCVAKKCTHFDGTDCQLAKRIAAGLKPVVAKLPPCAVRKTCRWYAQEGDSACHRCPSVVTHVTDKADPMREIAMPGGVEA